MITGLAIIIEYAIFVFLVFEYLLAWTGVDIKLFGNPILDVYIIICHITRTAHK